MKKMNKIMLIITLFSSINNFIKPGFLYQHPYYEYFFNT